MWFTIAVVVSSVYAFGGIIWMTWGAVKEYRFMREAEERLKRGEW